MPSRPLKTLLSLLTAGDLLAMDGPKPEAALPRQASLTRGPGGEGSSPAPASMDDLEPDSPPGHLGSETRAPTPEFEALLRHFEASFPEFNRTGAIAYVNSSGSTLTFQLDPCLENSLGKLLAFSSQGPVWLGLDSPSRFTLERGQWVLFTVPVVDTGTLACRILRATGVGFLTQSLVLTFGPLDRRQPTASWVPAITPQVFSQFLLDGSGPRPAGRTPLRLRGAEGWT